MGFSPLPTMLLQKSPLCGLKECLTHHHRIPHSIAKERVWQRMNSGSCSWNLPVFTCAPSPWSSCVEWWKGLLKTQLWCQLNVSTSWSLNSVSQDAACAVNQWSIHVPVSLEPGFASPGIKDRKWEQLLSLLLLVMHWWDFCFPFPTTLGSAGLDMLVPGKEYFCQGTPQWFH